MSAGLHRKKCCCDCKTVICGGCTEAAVSYYTVVFSDITGCNCVNQSHYLAGIQSYKSYDPDGINGKHKVPWVSSNPYVCYYEKLYAGTIVLDGFSNRDCVSLANTTTYDLKIRLTIGQGGISVSVLGHVGQYTVFQRGGYGFTDCQADWAGTNAMSCIWNTYGGQDDKYLSSTGSVSVEACHP